MNNNIVNIFESIASQNLSKIALVEKGRSVTYGELKSMVDQCTTRYSQKGINRGMKALVLIPVSIDLYVNVLALFKLSAVVVFTDEWVDKNRLAVCIDLVGIDVLVSNRKGYLYSHIHKGLRQISRKIMYKKSKEIIEFKDDSLPGESALVTFTTGSTGIPKAANRTHSFLTAQYTELSSLLKPISGGVCMTTLPIVALCCIGLGMTTVLPDYNHKSPSKSDIKAVIAQIINNKVTSVIGSPFLIHQLCDHAFAISETIRNIYVGGAAVFYKDASRWIDCFPKTKTEIIYGSTEAEPIAQINANQIVVNHAFNKNKGVCVGKVNANIECRIIGIEKKDIDSIDQASPMKEGEAGEVIVAGEHVLQSYINSPEAIKQNKIPDGNRLWHRTGDAGYMKGGYLYLVGRASQMITLRNIVTGIFSVEEQLSAIKGVNIGTVISKNDKNQVIINGTLTEESLHEINEIFGNLEIRTDINIPMDPRHHSKIDYGKLIELV